MADLAFSLAGTLLQKLGPLAYEEISMAWGMKDDLQKLKDTTEILETVLLDAEKKQQHDKKLRFWLTRLTDVFEDAQDVLDEFECELLRTEVVEEHGSFCTKVRRFFSSSNPLVFRFSIVHQIKEIRHKLDEIAKEMNKFQLISIQLNQDQRHLMQGTTEMTHSYVNVSDVIGRDTDKEKIIEMLLNQHHNDSDNNLSVIPIVGIGGLGKTTLAKSVYNDKNVSGEFDLRMWVWVSLDFDVTRLTREILISALQATNTVRDISNLSFDLLQTTLRDILKDKKFLLVLDDVWNEDRSKWTELRDFLTAGAKGSKIMVTTRNIPVASIMGTTPPHRLEGLLKEDSLRFFLKSAFGDEQLAEQFPKLKEIGRQIVEKCGGVPLALKTLGSVLYSKTDENEWKHIRDSEIWELKQEHNDHILSALRLSYTTMPSYLKQCFSYCALLEKDARMESAGLIQLWMALGILQSPGDQTELEDIGKSYFEQLCARSFFQYLKDKDFTNFNSQPYEMHDLIYDLAVSVIQEKRSIVSSSTKTIAENTRYLTIVLKDHDHSKSVLRILQKLKKVQSIILMYDRGCEESNVDESFVSTCISRFRYLRLFDLGNITLHVLPNSIGSLKHLRYLNLSYNKKIKKLPDSICNLQNLQILSLRGCEELEELPKDIKNLVSLRTLVVTTKQKYFQDNGLGCMKSLQFLYLISCNNLTSLPHDMKYCTTLRILAIACCEQLDLTSGPINKVTQLSLQTLWLTSLPETTTIPQWLQGAANTLQHLVIGGCPKLAALPEWLPNLTSLEKLMIGGCPKLLSLPEGMQQLTSLKCLVITECGTLDERCKRNVGEDWPKIAHVPNISIGDEFDEYSKDDSDD